MNTKLLAKELEFVTTGVIEKKTSIPILSNVLIDVKKRVCTLTGTDLEIAAVTAFPMPSEKAWKGTVPARSLLQVLKPLNGTEDTTLDWDGKACKLAIQSGTFESSLDGMSAESYPELPKIPEDGRIVFRAETLAAIFSAVKHAISSEESRFTLNGALLDLRGDTIKIVATDGHRLALASTPWKGDETTLRCLVQRSMLERVPGLRGATVEFAQDEHHNFYLARDGKSVRLLLERKLNGTFPDYERVIPKGDFKIHATVKRLQLLDLAKRMQHYADARIKAGRLTFRSTLGASSVTVSKCSDHGKGSGSIAAGIQEMGDLEIGISLQYLQDALRAFTSEDVEILAKDPESAMQINGSAGDGVTMQEIIMPVRI